MAIVCSLSNLKHTVPHNVIIYKILKRGLIIIGLGLFLNLFPFFDFAHVRIPGVLQRIGLCIVIAAPMALWCRPRAQLFWAVALVAVYAAVMLLVPVPDAAGAMNTGLLEPGRDVGAYIDRALMNGHLWASAKTWDPEGLLSTLPAVSSLLFGALTGHWLQSTSAPATRTAWLTAAGAVARPSCSACAATQTAGRANSRATAALASWCLTA